MEQTTKTRRPVVNFDAGPSERETIKLIVARIIPMARRAKADTDKTDWTMDIMACHCNGTPLDLEKLLGADDATFAHDVFGIRHHIDRSTGKIMDFFLPRCSKGE